jgi:chromosome segregation ATPase
MKSISERYQNAVNLFLENAEELDEAQKKEVQVNIELGAIKSGPGAGRRINQKEGNIRRQISRLEDDIAVWKNNISFFTSSSKQADKLIADVERKIEKATAELEQLKSQLSVLQSMR